MNIKYKVFQNMCHSILKDRPLEAEAYALILYKMSNFTEEGLRKFLTKIDALSVATHSSVQNPDTVKDMFEEILLMLEA